MKDCIVRVKETAEGLYYNADDIGRLIQRFSHRYPARSMRILWDVVRSARKEYSDGIQSCDDNDCIDRYLNGK